MKERFLHDILPLKDMLFRLALRLTTNREEAEDIVQETFIKLWERRDQWDAIESMESYAATLCHNLSLDRLRRMDNRSESINDHPTLPIADRAPSPLDHTISRDRLHRVQQIINQLPEKQRACIQLRDIEGKAYRDIAGMLGITESQVKVNIFRARQALRQQFQD